MFLFQDLPSLIQAFIALPFGLIIGSFLNVVIYRVPRGESVAFPGSHCGSCGTAVKAYDNIPLLSYLLLRGRCRACKAGISWVYPAVELLTGILFFLVIWRAGITAQGLAGVLFVSVIVALVFIDYRHQLLPNVITYPAFLLVMIFAALDVSEIPSSFGSFLFSQPVGMKPWIGGLLLLLAAPAFYLVDWLDGFLFDRYMVADDDDDIDDALRDVDEEQLVRQHNRVVYSTIGVGGLVAIAWIIFALLQLRQEASSAFWVNAACDSIWLACLGAMVAGGVIWFLRAIYFYTRGFGGMGLGDVKLMAVIGAFLGWPASILVLIIGSLAGSVVGVLQVALSKNQKGLKTKLPFGVFLGIGAILALFYGQAIVTWYMSSLYQ